MKQANTLAAAILIAIGCLQSVGFVLDWPLLKGVGFATAASPLPLVFSQFRGYETFATEFLIEIETTSGETIQEKATPALYGRLKGPYNRRNVYGVVFSHGPMFDKPSEIALRQGVLEYGLCHGGPLVKEFGLPENVLRANIDVSSKTVGIDRQWHLNIRCKS